MGNHHLALAYSSAQFVIKRCIDCALAVIAIAALAPLLVAIAGAILLESQGPVIFKQRRVGLGGRIFDMLKFRTMCHGADQSLHQAHVAAFAQGKLDEHEGVKLHKDSRVTRVGRLLRKTSVDELPQLFNVLLGHMSLVGPRPVPVYEADLYHLWHSQRLTVLPGITGLWQVTARSRVSFDEQIRLDIRYIESYSLRLDIEILLKTIPAAFSGRGAS